MARYCAAVSVASVAPGCADICSSCSFAAVAGRLWAPKSTTRMQDFLDTQRTEVTVTQHVAIVEALLAGAIESASELLAAHLDEARDQASQRAAAAVERMLTAGSVLVEPAGGSG